NASLIFEKYTSAEEIFKDSSTARRMAGCFTPGQIDKMESLYIEDTYKTVEACASLGVDVITCQDKLYPYHLRQIRDFPIALFVKGSLEYLQSRVPIAIVGTRQAKVTSNTAATELAKSLSKCGFAVVSGGALGVDSAAHTGAICAGEETFAVLGGGHGTKYLSTNEALRNVITNRGATISEYPPLLEPFPGSFPMRNRIISGMTVGTIIIEAHNKSGSLITAGRAADQGRDVFALPGVKDEKATDGSKKLLDEGCIEFKTALEIIEFYLAEFADLITINEEVDLSIDLTNLGSEYQKFVQETKKIKALHKELEAERLRRERSHKREITDPVSDRARRVYAAFGPDPLSIEKLQETMVMPLNELLSALTELEIYGYIELLADTNYVIK
ncbi:MAG: DNA-processing protein DprA, partial [Clostridia bacterium]|nr:DNA-processing protein DprA [Clostridia bacterium]